MGVAEAAAAAAGRDRDLPDGDEVGQQLAGLVVVDRRAGRDLEGQVVAGRAVPPGPLAAATGVRLEVVLVAEVAERGLAGIDQQPDRSAAAAVAAVRAAARHMGLVPERRGSVAAVTGLDEDRDAVEEHQADCRIRSAGSPPRSPDRADRRPGTAVASSALLQADDATGRRGSEIDAAGSPACRRPRPGRARPRSGGAGRSRCRSSRPARPAAPRPTDWPRPTVIDDMWLYVVNRFEPWAIQTW